MAQRPDVAARFQCCSSDRDEGGVLLMEPVEMGNPVVYLNENFGYETDEPASYSPRPPFYGLGQRHERQHQPVLREWSPSPEPPFITIREGTPPEQSGLSNHPHRYPRHAHDQYNTSQTLLHENALYHTPVPFLERSTPGSDPHPLPFYAFSPVADLEAANKVEQHLKRAKAKVKRHERILRALIHPKAHADKRTDFPLDNAALESIFSAADEIFFYGKLRRRVHWDWTSDGKHASSRRGDGGGSRIIGYTALRKAVRGDGYETLIVLSSPVLKDTSYNRRLLISTFLHELIHSYLFICNGFEARHCGGHTPGFKRIAELIDDWEGHDTLRLCDIEADLDRFREDQPSSMADLLDMQTLQPRHRHHERYEDSGHHNHHHHHHHQHRHHHDHHHHRHQQHHHHHPRHGGALDFYDLTFSADSDSDSTWSAGPQVIFRAYGPEMRDDEPRDGRISPTPLTIAAVPMSRISSTLSSAPTLVESQVQLRHAHTDLVPKLLVNAQAYYPTRVSETLMLS